MASGSRTLKDAINEAIRDWVTNVATTHYLLGSAVGPHPYPMMVRDFQSVIGREAREQILAAAGRLPDYAVACVGGGSNAMGLFHPFFADADVRLVGVEAGGEGLDERPPRRQPGPRPAGRAARLALLPPAGRGRPGAGDAQHLGRAGLPGRGAGAQLLQGDGPRHLRGGDGRRGAGRLPPAVPRREGILPALEPAHAIAYAAKLAPTLPPEAIILVCLSGRGDKDMEVVAQALGLSLPGARQ